MIKHLKFPLNPLHMDLESIVGRKLCTKLLLMCPDSGVIKHMIMHLDEEEGHPLP